MTQQTDGDTEVKRSTGNITDDWKHNRTPTSGHQATAETESFWCHAGTKRGQTPRPRSLSDSVEPTSHTDFLLLPPPAPLLFYSPAL